MFSRCASLNLTSFIFSLLIGLAGNYAAACDDTVALSDLVDNAVRHEMRRQQAVGVATGILINNQIAFINTYGMEDREQQVPVTRDTMFRWASISKSLTAITLLQLAEQDLVELDQQVNHFLPTFPIQRTTDGKPYPITVRQLLCHQAGIVHYTNGTVKGTDRTYLTTHPYRSVQRALNDFNQSPLVHVPGTAYAYSTRGYILLSAITEQIGHHKFHKQVDRGIAKPLGMETLQPDFQWKSIAHRAVGYRKLSNGVIVRSTDTDVSWKLGGGGFISNIGDLARFAEGLMQHRLVQPDTEWLMWEPNKTSVGLATKYGLGFQLSIIANRKTVGHSGSQEKTKTRLALDLETGTGVVLMSNSEQVDTARFVAAIFKALKTINR